MLERGTRAMTASTAAPGVIEGKIRCWRLLTNTIYSFAFHCSTCVTSLNIYKYSIILII